MSSERDRLERVYGEYDRSPVTTRRRDPENPGQQAILSERNLCLERHLAQVLSSAGAEPRMLDLGCGRGDTMAMLRRAAGSRLQVVGADLLWNRVAAAHRPKEGLNAVCASGQALPFDSGRFDIVVLATVISSIVDRTVAEDVAAEVRRVLRPTGSVLWYDMRYPNPGNASVMPVSRRRLSELFPDFVLNVQPVTVLPPLVRALGRTGAAAYKLLARAPFLCSHYVGTLTRIEPNGRTSAGKSR